MPHDEETRSTSSSYSLDGILQAELTQSSRLGSSAGLLRFLYSFVASSYPPPLIAYCLIPLSFLQFFSLLVIPLAGGSYSSGLKNFRVFPLVDRTGSTLLYYTMLVMCMILTLSYTLFAASTLCFPARLHNGRISWLIRELTPYTYWVLAVPVTESLLSVWDSQYMSQSWSGVRICRVAIIGTAMPLLWTLAIWWVSMATAVSHTADDSPLAHYPAAFDLWFSVLRLLFQIRLVGNLKGVMVGTLADAAINVVVAGYLLSLVRKVYPYYDQTASWVFCGGVLSVAANSGYHFFNLVVYSLSSIQEIYETSMMFGLTALSFCLVKATQRARRMRLISQMKCCEGAELDAKIRFLISASAGVDKEFASHAASLWLSMANHAGQEPIPAFARALLRQARELAEKDPTILVQSAYIQLAVFRNAYAADLALSEAERLSGLGLVNLFFIYCVKMKLKRQLEEEKEREMRQGSGDFYGVLRYEEEYRGFCELLEKSAGARLQFWHNLECKPDLAALHSLGLEMIELGQSAAEQWDKLTAIYPDHWQALLTYSKYLYNILGQASEAEALISQVERSIAQHSQNEFSNKRLYAGEAVSLLLSYSAGHYTRILRASVNVKQLFGYPQKSLRFCDLAVLMPKIVGRNHSAFMRARFLRGELPICHESFARHQSGYIFPVKVAVQRIYSPASGLMYVGNIQRDPTLAGYNFVLTDSQGFVQGMSKEIAEFLCVTSDMISDGELTIQKCCHELKGVESVAGIVGAQRLTFAARRPTPQARSKSSRSNSFERSRAGPERSGNVCVRVADDVPSRVLVKCEVSTVKFGEDDSLTMKVFRFPTIRLDQSRGRKELGTNGTLTGVIDVDIGGRSHNILANPASTAFSKFLLSDLPAPTPASPDSSTPDTGIRTGDFALGSGNAAHRHDSSSGSFVGGVARSTHNSEGLLSPIVAPPTTTGVTESRLLLPQEKTQDPARKSTFAVPELAKKSKMSGKTAEKSTSRGDTASTKDDAVSSRTSAMLRKRVGFLRRQTYDEFYPRSVKRFRHAIVVVALVLFAVFSVRLYFAVSLNARFSSFARLMLSSSKRIASLSRIGKNVRELTFYGENDLANDTIIDDSARVGYFGDYTRLLPEGYRGNVGSYKAYLEQGMRGEVPQILAEVYYIQAKLGGFSRANYDLVEQPAIKVVYPASSSIVSISTAFLSIVSHAFTFLDTLDLDGDSRKLVSAYYIIGNALGTMIKTTRVARDGFLNEYDLCKSLLDKVTLILLIVVAGLLFLFMVVMCPFLLLVQKEQTRTLVMLTKISQAHLHKQEIVTRAFLKCIAKDIAAFKSENVAEDTADWDQGSNPDHDESRAVVDHITASLSPETKPRQEHATGKAQRAGIQEEESASFAMKKSRLWTIFVVFAVFSGSMIGLFVGYSMAATDLMNKIMYQSDEMYLVNRGLYYSRYHLAYLYQYFYTNRTGSCATSPCESYITTRIDERLLELNQLLVYHNGNSSLMLGRYNTLFRSLVEGNPCTSVDAFKQISSCSTLFGSSFARGLYVASIDFITREKDIKKDFESHSMSRQNIIDFINDERMIELEAMSELFLVPAYLLLAEQITADAETVTAENNVVAVWYYLGLVTVLLAMSAGGGYWVLRHLRRGMYDTKSMLSRLPCDLIRDNKFIVEYLLSTSDGV